MFIDNLDDTIAAISTAVGEGAVGIVRLSGPKALESAGRIKYPENEGGVLKVAVFRISGAID